MVEERFLKFTGKELNFKNKCVILYDGIKIHTQEESLIPCYSNIVVRFVESCGGQTKNLGGTYLWQLLQ